ncbi:MAG: PAS domain S-box protein [Bacteroidetes bacterium]|nr:PAS domain S-box protein [Bacteroidota bacterium]
MLRGDYETNAGLGSELDALPIPGFIVDSGGELLSYNHYFQEICNEKKQEPKSLVNILTLATVQFLDLGKKVFRFQFHDFESEGETRRSYVLWPIHDDPKIAREIRTGSRQRMQQMEDILAAVPDLIYVVNEEGIYLDCRAFDEKDLPRPLDQIVGSSFWDMPESDELKKKIWQLILVALRTGRTQTIEYERKNRFGHLHFYEARISKSSQDTAVYIVRNITERIVAQKELASSELKWKSIVENGYDSIILLNRDGRIRYASSHSASFFGKTPGELMEMQAIRLLPQYSTRLIRLYYKLLEGKEKRATLHVSIPDPNGHLIHLESAWISRLDDSEINAIIINFRDITKQVEFEKNLKSNQETIQTILRTTSAGIVILEGTKIIFTNNQFAQLLEYKSHQLLGKDISTLAHSNDRLDVVQRAARRKQGDTSQLHYKIRALTQNGETKWLDCHSGSIQYKGKNAVIVTVNDITEQQNFEQKLIEAKEGAEELAKLKSSFLANMSHEIRTPLNGVLGLAELISMSEDLDEIKEYVDLQKDSGMRLLNTLTSILDLSRLEAENATLELIPVDMNKLVSDTYKIFKLPFAKKELELICELPINQLVCMGDETMLQQVMTNLVGNALKFTEEGSCTLRLFEEHSKKGQDCIIEIEDSGVGISEEFLPYVFDTFRQELNGSSRKYEGSGLGLAITQKYLTLLKGSISVKSAKNTGSCFTLRIPLKENSQPKKKKSA